jgi:hypothetical protein
MGVRIHAYAFEPGGLPSSLDLGAAPSSNVLHRELEELITRADSTIWRVLGGVRRWWIGSFVQSCREQPLYADSNDVAAAELLFARLLRGHTCGAVLPEVAYGLADVDFPAIPLEDADFRMATFDSLEANLLQSFIGERLAEPDRTFARPPGPIGIAPQADTEWDTWVREAAGSIARARLTPSAYLLSFIG